MGGIQLNFTGVKHKPPVVSPNLQKKEKSRRLTSTSPNPSNKLVSQFVKMNTLNFSNSKNRDNEKREEPKHLFEVIPEVSNRKKKAQNEKNIPNPHKVMAKISQKKKSHKTEDNSKIVKQHTLKTKVIK